MYLLSLLIQFTLSSSYFYNLKIGNKSYNDSSNNDGKKVVLYQNNHELDKKIIKETRGSCGDNVFYTLSASTLKISGTGKMKNYTKSSSPFYPNRTVISNVNIENGVTSIGDYSFYYCSKIQYISIPNSVTYIGQYSISYCSQIKSITLPKNIKTIERYTFYYCDNLISMLIPEGVTILKEWSFHDCRKMASISIPDSVIKIESHVFHWCYALTSIEIPKNVHEIYADTFSECINLTRITFHGNLNTIYPSSFSNTKKLTTIYYYGTKVPSISVNQFNYANNIYVSTDYQGTTFGNKTVNKILPPIYTSFFSPSEYFSHSKYFSYSNEFSQSTYFSMSNYFSFSELFSLSDRFSISKYFSLSDHFTLSKYFTFSYAFSKTHDFTKTIDFSKTNFFSNSDDFTKSCAFSISKYFTQSNKFTSTNAFSNSETFTSSETFTKSDVFTMSDIFSDSFSFAPTPTESIYGEIASLSYLLSHTYTRIRTVVFSNYETHFKKYTICFSNSYCEIYDKSITKLPYIIYSYSPTFTKSMLNIIFMKKKGLNESQLIGVISGSIGIFFLILGIIINVVNKKYHKSNRFEDSETSSNKDDFEPQTMTTSQINLNNDNNLENIDDWI